MAIQRIDPHLQTLQQYTRRNLDHKLIIQSFMTAIQDVDSRRTADILDMLRTERDELIRENAFLSTEQPDRPGRHLIVADGAPGSNFPASDEWLNEQTTLSEHYQKLHDQLADLVRRNSQDDKQAPEPLKMMLRLTELQLIPRPQQSEQGHGSGQS